MIFLLFNGWQLKLQVSWQQNKLLGETLCPVTGTLCYSDE